MQLPFEIIFGVLALIVIATGLGMLISRNAIYSVMFLVINFTIVAMLYLTLGAPFIALSQITVYAGAIMVLFLFVIMLLGGEKLSVGEPLRGQRIVAILLALVLLAQAGLLILGQVDNMTPLNTPSVDFGEPKAIGLLMFTRYQLPVMIIAFMLLVSSIGAIVLTRAEQMKVRKSMSEKKEG
jgi:NADH-quinone oxidoreductase subunit J